MIEIACSVGEYMQESIEADSILEQTFLHRESELLALVCIKIEKLSSPQYPSDRSVKSHLACTIRKRTTASD